MRKTIKNIMSLGVATTVLAATLSAGAVAADLSQLPAPFVKNGVADVQVVIGAKAAAIDTLGAIDISTMLQASSYTEEAIETTGTSATKTVEGGVYIESNGNHLKLANTLYSVDNKLTDTDMSELLADGIVEDDDNNEDYDYTQELIPGNLSVTYDAAETDLDDIALYLDLDNGSAAGSKVAWTYIVDFKGGDINLSELTDSETITMLGKKFTFDPSITATGDITMYGSDETVFLELDEPKTVVTGGKSYTLEITGANSESATEYMIISVNGKQEKIEEGQTKTINGLELFVDDLFVVNIPSLQAQASVFVGSQKIKLPGATATTCSYTDVEVSGESINGLEVCTITGDTASDNGALTELRFRFVPTDLDDDERTYLLPGESLIDPVFETLNVSFEGANYDLESEDGKSYAKLTKSGKELVLEFTNEDDEDITLPVYKLESGSSPDSFGYVWSVDSQGYNGSVQNWVREDMIIILNEGSAEKTTKVFEVASFTTDNNVAVVKLTNQGTGQTETYKAGDEIVDGTTVAALDAGSDKHLNLSSASSTQVYLKGGKNLLDLQYMVGNNTAASSNAAEMITNLTAAVATQVNVTLSELDRDEASASGFNFTLAVDTTDDDFTVAASVIGAYTADDDDSGDHYYWLSQYGTFVHAEDKDDDFVEFWAPLDEDHEVYYNVFYAPTDATVTVTDASGKSLTTQKINKISVGTAVLDTTVGNVASAKKNLIVVGGPCANSIASELMGNPAVCYAGFETGTAMIKLFDIDGGKVAMLVAGAGARETRAAAYAIANKDAMLKGMEVSLDVTSETDFTVKPVTARPTTTAPAVNSTNSTTQ